MVFGWFLKIRCMKLLINTTKINFLHIAPRIIKDLIIVFCQHSTTTKPKHWKVFIRKILIPSIINTND